MGEEQSNKATYFPGVAVAAVWEWDVDQQNRPGIEDAFEVSRPCGGSALGEDHLFSRSLEDSSCIPEGYLSGIGTMSHVNPSTSVRPPRLTWRQRIPSLAKAMVFETLRLPAINALLRTCRPLFSRLDVRTVDRFPVCGRIVLSLAGEKSFVMQSDGKDSVASAAFWVGLDAY